MFFDTMESRTEEKKFQFKKPCLDNVGSDMWNYCLNCPYKNNL